MNTIKNFITPAVRYANTAYTGEKDATFHAANLAREFHKQYPHYIPAKAMYATDTQVMDEFKSQTGIDIQKMIDTINQRNKQSKEEDYRAFRELSNMGGKSRKKYRKCKHTRKSLHR